MSLQRDLEATVRDSALKVAAKSERIAALLVTQPGRGVAAAVDGLLSTQDDRLAVFLAAYLSLLPGAEEAKARAAGRLLEEPELALAATWLVPWLPAALIDRVVAEYTRHPDSDSPLASVVFAVGVFAPERLRAHRKQLLDDDLRKAMLSGGPDEWVDEFRRRWSSERSVDALDSIARFRTAKAAGTLHGLRDEVDDREQWETWIEMAGLMPDGRSPSHASPAFMGFVAERAESPHQMGGRWGGVAPLCAVCDAPAQRVLTLSASSLPFALRDDPSFFWYSCECGVLESTSTQQLPGGLRVIAGPAGDGGNPTGPVPGARSLVLTLHPNQSGVSVDATGGFARHQVGGAPQWIQPVAHPHCPLCRAPMKFLASIDSGMTPFGRLGFTGILYGFWCDPCATTTMIRQA